MVRGLGLGYMSAAAHILLRPIPWSRRPTSLSQNRAFAVVGPALRNYTPNALRNVMLQGVSSASLRGYFEDFSFHLPVTLRAPLNSL